MATATSAPRLEWRDQTLTLPRIDWRAYVAINDALGENPGARMIYSDGSLTFLVTSRLHDWYGERLAQLIVAVADGCEILWEDAGRATFRREAIDSGLEGDGTFYFGDHAETMKGPTNIDLSTQPPPDLAFEIEVSRSADKAMIAYGRLGVPEVWRFDAEAWIFGFWLRREDGTYAEGPRSLALPMIEAAEIVAQLRLCDEIGAARWFRQLRHWVAETVVPRVGEGA